MPSPAHIPGRPRSARFRAAAAACALAACLTAAQAPIAGADDVPSAPPVNQTPPALSYADGVLHTSNGEWVGVTKPYEYSWLRCQSSELTSCSQVPGETASYYRLTRADTGSMIRGMVTASNELGSSSAATDPTDPIPAFRDPPQPPTPSPRASKLRPFPVVVLAGRQGGGRTRITEFVVRGPRHARVRVACKSRGCPVRRARGTIGATKRLRVRRVERLYRAGTKIEVRVTAPGRIGKFTRITIRGDRAPSRSDSCLQPGATRPSPCPRG